MAGDDRGGAAARADPRAQQDARGPAVQRVPDVLPAQLGRVLRLLLRLLPAGGLRPVAGPLHREGLGDQPGDRPAAPRRHRLAVRPPRRDHRGLACRRSSASARRRPTTPTSRSSSRAASQDRDELLRKLVSPAVHAQRHGARPRDVPRARGHAGGLPGLRGDRVPRVVLRRRGGAPAALRPADGRADRRRPRARRDLAGHALQRQGGHDRERGRGDRPRAQRALRRAGGRGQAAGVPPPAPAHAVRHGDAARGRVLLRHRELLAHPRRRARPARGRTA